VVVSLLYVSRQIAINHRLAEAWRASTHAVTTLNAAFGVNPQQQEILRLGQLLASGSSEHE